MRARCVFSKLHFSLHFEAQGWRAKERSLLGVQQDWFARTTWDCTLGNCYQLVLAWSSTILLIWFGRLYGTTQEKNLPRKLIYLTEMESLECIFFPIFWRSFKTKKTLLSFSKDKVFNFWLSKVKCFILHEGFYLSVSSLLYIFLWTVGWGFQNLPPLVLTVVCGVRKVEPISYLEIFHLCRKGRAESDVDLCCCKPFCWLYFKSSCTPAAQLCWARGFITHCPAYQVHRFVSAWAAIIWHFIWKAFAVLSWQHSVVHIFLQLV